jgi:hypothetical protein
MNNNISVGGSVVSLLAENHGISCIDVNLEDPVTVIVDNVTAICLTDEVYICIYGCVYTCIYTNVYLCVCM